MDSQPVCARGHENKVGLYSFIDHTIGLKHTSEFQEVSNSSVTSASCP